VGDAFGGALLGGAQDHNATFATCTKSSAASVRSQLRNVTIFDKSAVACGATIQ
jgi:hypothetical protein